MLTPISGGQLTLFSIGYLLLLFAIAWLAEHGRIPRSLVRHPLVQVLSLGIYTSAWAFYGTVGLAYQHGYAFLAIYLGLSAAFLMAPVLLAPLLKLTQTHQLASLADLFAFRFRSSAAGTLTALGLLLCSLPLLALQIQAVADSALLLTGASSASRIALYFCLIMMLFSILFGARHVSTREKHQGVVFAMAFESLLKLIALCLVGGYALFHVFGGPAGLEVWLNENRALLDNLQEPLQDGAWRMLLLLFFAAAVTMPHVYHMQFSENLNPRALRFSSWGLPLFLLLMSVPVPLILWAGLKLQAPVDAQYFSLGLGLVTDNPGLALLTFMGGMSAASGIIIVLSLALSGMALNHLVLPLYQPPTGGNLYLWLKWIRRLLIAVIILAGYGFYLLLGSGHALTQLGTIAFSGAVNFLPGVLALLYWPRANRNGFIAGSLSGLLIWGWGLLLPMLGINSGLQLPLTATEHHWYQIAGLALLCNTLVFVLASLLSRTSLEEERSRQACLVDGAGHTKHRSLKVKSPEDFATALAAPLGPMAARRELEQALQDLQMSPDENRSFALRRLRDRIESNLSGLLGPGIAQDLMDSFIPWHSDSSYVSEDIHFMESRLVNYRSQLTGLAAELDMLRRYQKQILQELPLAVCALSSGGTILIWNRAMEGLTGIAAARAAGSNLDSLDAPWNTLLGQFAGGSEQHKYQTRLHSHFGNRWLNLHKAEVNQRTTHAGLVLLIEDVTENHQLGEQLIHAQRLASLGRLSAGVAHEIGNPVTGIACLAQMLQEDHPDNSDVLEMSSQILEQTRRIVDIIQSMTSFSRSSPADTRFDPTDWHLICKEAINLLSLNPDATPVSFINQCDPHHPIMGDSQRLGQVVVNLLANARDASNAQDEIQMDTRLTGGQVILRISDNGNGIPPEQQTQLFEPFFTTKDPGEGTGLGLAMAYAIIKEHGGSIRVESPWNPQNRGTRFYIQLPAHLQQ